MIKIKVSYVPYCAFLGYQKIDFINPRLNFIGDFAIWIKPFQISLSWKKETIKTLEEYEKS